MIRDFDKIQSKTGDLTIDLTGNLFHCHCHEKHTSTIHWWRHTDVTIVNFEQLQCIGANDKELIHSKDLRDYDKHCSVVDEVVTTVLCTLAAVLTISLTTRAYHKRRAIITYICKLRLWPRFNRETFDFDVYLCYVHDDDAIMEKIRYFLEEECRLKCCIPQRNFPYNISYLDAVSLHVQRSASTLVLLSEAALLSDAHHLERSLARHVELHRSFTHRVMYVALEELCDVTCDAEDDDVTLVLKSGKLLKWKPGGDERDEAEFMTRLLRKVCGKIL